MARICILSVLSLIIFFLMWSTTTKGLHHDQTDDFQHSLDVFELSGSGDHRLEREKRDEPETNKFYEIEQYVNESESIWLWEQRKTLPYRWSNSLTLPFDFPFFGQSIRNIFVSARGFLYTGINQHSWYGPTQYIAPLRCIVNGKDAKFFHVYVVGNDTAVLFVWQDLVIENKSINITFTFTVTLQQNGEITFVYHRVPLEINTLDSNEVGLSDAYIIQSHHRKTIYEYSRVDIEKKGITNGTIIRLKPLPTCQVFKNCESCLSYEKCTWCNAVNRCSTRDGLDRGKQEWDLNDCEIHAISQGSTCSVPKQISSTQDPESTTYETTYQSTATFTEDQEDSTVVLLNHNPIETFTQFSISSSSIYMIHNLCICVCLFVSYILLKR